MKYLNKTTVTRNLIAIAVAATISLPAMAGKNYGHKSNYNSGHRSAHSVSYQNAGYDYAKVIQVNPVFEHYKVNQPIEQCYHKEVPVRKSHLSLIHI